MSFVHLHRHGEYSLLDGLGTGKQHAQRAADLGQEALAVTDHGTMAGVLYHWKACEGVDDNGNRLHDAIKPIVGIEAYFRWDAKTHDKDTNWAYNHLVLLAKNEEGFRNLMRLTSASFDEENYYRKPCIDLEMIRRCSEGIIATSSCPAGAIPKDMFNGIDPRPAVDRFLDIFGDDFFMEIQPHGWDGQKMVNSELVTIAREKGIPIVATADAHYPDKDDYETHQVLIAINTNMTIEERKAAQDDGEDILFGSDDRFYLMSEKEMRDSFAKNHPSMSQSTIDESIANTVLIADRVEDYSPSKEPKLPRATSSKLEAERILREWCAEGLLRIGKDADPVYLERVERELKVMKARGVMDYFVIVGRMVRKAKGDGIRVGPGRGSAAGSLVMYLSRITGIDPIGYGLVFERFMSEYRIEMPDVDVDFQHTRRDEVKDDLKATWGDDHVIDVAAFQTFQMKSAVKDVGKAFGVPYDETGRVSKEIDAHSNRHEEQHLDDIADASDIVRSYRDRFPEAWKHACNLEGQIKGISKHPAAVVITDKPVSEYMPTMRAADGVNRVTQWAERADFHVITNYGFLKIDVLSIDGLTAQQHAIDLIRERHGVRIDFEDPGQFPIVESPDLGDPEVIEFFGKGPYQGIHQFMSKGITDLLKDISPDSLEDIIAANALFRPGPIKSGICFEYPKLKNGRMTPREWHPAVARYLEKTFGLIVYQEQVMAIIAQLGGFDPQESYIVFKSMTKWHVSKQRGIKGTEKLMPLAEKFVEGCMAHGVGQAEAMSIWEGIAAMSHYSFNKSHSAGYAMEAYQDAWLKVKYPLEFYASLLTWEKDRVPRVIREARRQGISVLPPDVNESGHDFTIVGNSIRFGLPAIKGVASAATGEILANRPFKSFEDFCERTVKAKCNRRVKKALLGCGAFDGLGGRSEWILDEDGEKIPGSLTEKERASQEKALIGFSLGTKSNIAKHAKLVKDRLDPEQAVEGMEDGAEVFVGGELARLNEIETKKGDPMAFADFEFEENEYSVTFFPEMYSRHRHLLAEGNGLLVKGTWQPERHTVIADAVCTVEQYAEAMK